MCFSYLYESETKSIRFIELYADLSLTFSTHWDVCTIFSFIDSDMLHNLVSEDGLVDHSVDESLPVQQGDMDTDPRHSYKRPTVCISNPSVRCVGRRWRGRRTLQLCVYQPSWKQQREYGRGAIDGDN